MRAKSDENKVPKERLGCDQLPTPIKLVGDELPIPEKAPTVGQHNDVVLTQVLGYDDVKIKALREAGARFLRECREPACCERPAP